MHKLTHSKYALLTLTILFGTTTSTQAQVITDRPVAGGRGFCKEAIYFDTGCRKDGFFRGLLPENEIFIGVFGSTGRKGQASSAVVFSLASTHTIRAYHLSDKQRRLAKQQSPIRKIVPSDKPRVVPKGREADVPLPYGGYTLLSRVTSVRGLTDGYSSIYSEIAVPTNRFDLTLFASAYKQWGPSSSFETVECYGAPFIDASDDGVEIGCYRGTTIPTGSGESATSLRRQCTSSEEVAAEVTSWAVTAACGAAGAALVTKLAGRASTVVFAGVTVETANPLVGGVAGGGTFVFISSTGAIVVTEACSASGAAVEEFVDQLTGCNQSGKPTSGEDTADIYDTFELIESAGREWVGEPGVCLVCSAMAVETVGGGWNPKTGTIEVIGETFCKEWSWQNGSDANGDGWCD
ncbi:hypothetical protein CKO42_23205 [Lamprobacter modestohalophilus]|uniref:Uncharacterized protein n=1 Tax=Lamprobacter modestohalophilus TaxID=1064514 RepID=A0A9X1B6V8_9GAMM|nr:hypothetical protein [Lamprobacter modestohalophilus]MBK1621271.1 hypothetical protein [Lamprobacter modestohalophilus]